MYATNLRYSQAIVKEYYVYILSNQRRTVLYIGVTNNLARRLYEHKNKLVEGFTKRYNCDELLYFEEASSIDDAIVREKQLKKWSRSKKIILVQRNNPSMQDLSASLEMTG